MGDNKKGSEVESSQARAAEAGPSKSEVKVEAKIESKAKESEAGTDKKGVVEAHLINLVVDADSKIKSKVMRWWLSTAEKRR